MARLRSTLAASAALLALAGCTSGARSSDSAGTSAGGTIGATASASVDACADFRNALERTVTQFAYLKVAVGSDLDETERLGTLTDYTGTLAADAPACAPAAASTLATLKGQTADLVTAYVPNADGAVAEGIFGILVEIRATGEQAWTQMGRPIGSWKELPLHEDGSTLE